jgi:hypothetical protein
MAIKEEAQCIVPVCEAPLTPAPGRDKSGPYVVLKMEV